ncbi:hypothetical protein D9M73_291880 [compost metagenome]
MRPQEALRNVELFRILDADQVEPVRVRRHPALAADAAIQDLLRPLDRLLASTDGHQHSGDVAHHVVQEGAGTDIQHDHLAVTRDAQVMKLLDRRLGLALTGAKSAEIMGTD